MKKLFTYQELGLEERAMAILSYYNYLQIQNKMTVSVLKLIDKIEYSSIKMFDNEGKLFDKKEGIAFIKENV